MTTYEQIEACKHPTPKDLKPNNKVSAYKQPQYQALCLTTRAVFQKRKPTGQSTKNIKTR